MFSECSPALTEAIWLEFAPFKPGTPPTISIGDEFYHRMPTIRRRIEIVAFEQERVVRHPLSTSLTCPVCHLNSEMLTVRQAGALAQVRAASIRRWLMRGQAHGVRTSGGHHRICSNSLFTIGKLNPEDSRSPSGHEPVETTIARMSNGVSTGSDSHRVAIRNKPLDLNERSHEGDLCFTQAQPANDARG